MATETKTFYPGEYDKSDYSYASISGATNPVGKGSDNTGSYATINLKTGSGATTYTRWPFDCSSIPSGATIDSVACKVAVLSSSTSSFYVSTRTLQLYSGTTAKGSATTISSTSRSVYTLSCGAWTRDELQSCNLYIYARRGSSSTSTSRNIQFYGADLTVTYTYQSEKFMLKLGGAWHDIARVFKKVSGIWVEQTALANVIEDWVRYQNGGEIISSNKTVSIVGSGDSTNCYATINGVKYTSKTKLSVPIGTVITVVANGSSHDYYGSVVVDGTEILPSQGTNVTYDYIVTANTVLCFNYYVEQSTYSATNLIFSEVNRNVIAFMLAEQTFACEEGMTWEEYVGSRYNIFSDRDDKLIISGNRVAYTYNGTIIAYVSGVTPATVIVEGGTYTLS